MRVRNVVLVLVEDRDADVRVVESMLEVVIRYRLVGDGVEGEKAGIVEMMGVIEVARDVDETVGLGVVDEMVKIVEVDASVIVKEVEGVDEMVRIVEVDAIVIVKDVRRGIKEEVGDTIGKVDEDDIGGGDGEGDSGDDMKGGSEGAGDNDGDGIRASIGELVEISDAVITVPDAAASEEDKTVDERLTTLLAGGTTTQFVCAAIRSLMSVTAPFNAYRPPPTVTPAFTVIEVSARMLPTKTVAVPSVADDPTCQKTLHACAPLMRTTLEAVAEVSVNPIWKTNTAFGLFWPSRTSAPVIPTDDAVV